MALRLAPSRIALTTAPRLSSVRAHLQLPIRTMSTSAAGRKYEFLVVVPDIPGTIEKRLAVRPTHFANLKPGLEAGIYSMGGAVLNSVPKDDEPTSLDFAGSTFVCIAESKEEVVEMLKKDVYAESGVWDVEKAQVWPFKKAFMKG